MAKPPSPPPRRVSGANQSYAPLWLSITFVLVVTVSLPSVVMLFFAMLPSVVAFIVDRTPQKHATYCVTGLNFSGVFPYLLDLWAGDHTVDAAIALVTNVFALLTMYGAAAVGWAIFAAVAGGRRRADRVGRTARRRIARPAEDADRGVGRGHRIAQRTDVTRDARAIGPSADPTSGRRAAAHPPGNDARVQRPLERLCEGGQPRGGGLNGTLHLLEGPHLDLTDPLARDAVL